MGVIVTVTVTVKTMISLLVGLTCSSLLLVASQQIQPTAQSRLFPLNSVISKANINEFGGTIPLGRVHHTLASSTNYVISFGGYRTDGSLSNGSLINNKNKIKITCI